MPLALTRHRRKENDMRKTGIMMIAAAAMLAMSACGSSDKTQSSTTKTTQSETKKEIVKETQAETLETAQKQTEAETETESETTENATAENTSTSEDEASSELASEESNAPQMDSALSEILDKIYEIKKPEFAFDSMAVDFDDEYAVSSYMGLTMDDVTKVDAAIVSEPMMSSQAYSLVLARVKDKADAAEIAQKMADGVNPRKWVCVEADDLTVVSKDDIIMLFMADSELSFTADDAVAAFTEVCGKPDQTYQPK